MIALWRIRRTLPLGFLVINYNLLAICFGHKLLNMTVSAIERGHDYNWKLGNVMCKIHTYFAEIGKSALIYQMVILTIYMVLCVRKPNLIQKFDNKKAVAIYLSVYWILIFLGNAEYIGANGTNDASEWTRCYGRNRTERHRTLLGLMIILFHIILPGLTMIGMSLYLWYYQRQPTSPPYIQMSYGMKRPLADFVRASISLSIIFTVCCSPAGVIMTRIFLGYFKLYFTVAFWFALDICWFLWTMYPVCIPLVLICSFQDLKMEVNNLLARLIGLCRRKPVTSISMPVNTDVSTQDKGIDNYVV